MTSGPPPVSAGPGLRWVAGASAVFVGILVATALLYLLLDILFIVFFGIIVAAAVQPFHARLCAAGVAKGPAAVVIYLLVLTLLGGVIFAIGPTVVEQIGTVVSTLPERYASFRSELRSADSAIPRLVGYRLPSFDRLFEGIVDASPEMYWGVIGATSSVFGLVFYFVSTLAVAFYWTLEVSRLERLVVSLLPVSRRISALSTWHEIESRLGAFIRAQGLAMLVVGVVSGIGFWLIGLPNVLALAVLAGLLEGVPMIGPFLAAVPAVLVALPLGLDTALLVVAFCALMQAAENNILIPRLMDRAVGVSALVSIVALLAFGTLYGAIGVLLAIPATAVIQVLLESAVNRSLEPTLPAEGLDDAESPWATLRARARAVRGQARNRTLERSSRMGIDPGIADHLGDAADQQIEQAAERVERILDSVEDTAAPLPADERAALMEKLDDATKVIEGALKRVEDRAGG